MCVSPSGAAHLCRRSPRSLSTPSHLPPNSPPSPLWQVVQARFRGFLVAVKSVRPSKGTRRRGEGLSAVAGLAASGGGGGGGAASPAERAQLEQEIGALARLKHTNIVTMLGVCYPGSAPGEVWLVEELAECDVSDFLDELVGRGKGMTPEHVFKLGLDVARGMAFMHTSGFSHNDLKCSNILLCKGTAVVCDFGLVAAFTKSLAGKRTVGGALGTFAYMAPENFSASHAFYRKPTADVYSYGCVLYEMATGQCPFEEESGGAWGMPEYYTAVCVEQRRPGLQAVASPELRAVIAQCWAHDPAARPNAAALVATLTALHVRSAPGPPGAGEVEAVRKLVAACQRHGIRPEYIRALRNLEAFDIILIADDSGSMARSNTQGDGRVTTRFGELQDAARVVVDIAAAVDQDGCDVYFLNRPDVVGARDPAPVLARFAAPPSGSTPLTATLTRALHAKGYRLSTEAAGSGGGGGGGGGAGALPPPSGKRLLFLIATDGVPDDGVADFTAALRALPENCFVQLMAVTDDEAAVGWMNELDGQVRFVDVNDDYESERREVLAKQGAGFAFTRGDYIAKVLLGAIDPFFGACEGCVCVCV